MGFGKGLAEFLASGGLVATLESIKSLNSYLKSKPDETSKSTQEVVEKVLESVPAGAESTTLSPEVMDELKKGVCGVLKEQASQVYAYYVILFSEYPLNEDVKEQLERILMNHNDESELWEGENDARCQGVVNDFMMEYADGWEIGDEYIAINFIDQHLCCESEVRELAERINYLLGDSYITRFSFS